MLGAPLIFQSTPSVGRATEERECRVFHQKYFNPRPPWGGRHFRPVPSFRTWKFQSTPSVGRATLWLKNLSNFFSISIHALRGEGDPHIRHREPNHIISIHALRGEGDCFTVRMKFGDKKFQSTPSVGRATRYDKKEINKKLFQSTPSVGRATFVFRSVYRGRNISIHALRGEGDVIRTDKCNLPKDFNPRPPWGGRPCWFFHVFPHLLFQSTPSVGRATFLCGLISYAVLFQSTPSVGRATNLIGLYGRAFIISIHALRGEGDTGPTNAQGYYKSISIHALRGEGDCKNIQICNAMLVHSAYKTVYFCDSCAFYLT